MVRSATIVRVDSDFDRFLFALIGEEQSGLPLSVLSALTRLDIDPWRETAELARMPKETAHQRLASLIATLPGPAPWPEPAAIAARLIALLPHAPLLPANRSGTSLGARVMLRFRALI